MPQVEDGDKDDDDKTNLVEGEVDTQQEEKVESQQFDVEGMHDFIKTGITEFKIENMYAWNKSFKYLWATHGIYF